MRNRHLHLTFLACLVALVLVGITIFGLQAASATSSTILISAVYYDTHLLSEPDESFRLTNVSAAPIDLSNWTATDGEGVITLTGSLDAGDSIWIANQAVSFTLEFGIPPDYEYGGDTDPAVPDLILQGNFILANSGDELTLKNDAAAIVDSVVWVGGTITDTGWSGPTIGPYNQDSFGLEGQILYRKLDQRSGQPVPDTNTDHDWAQATDDNLNGKKVLYPGWDLERYFQTAKFTQTAVITYLIAPDNIFENVRQAISQTDTSLLYEGYTFDNAELGLAMAARAAAGVSVTVLLEGAPVGGVGDQDKWVCQQIETAGGQCWFLINDTTVSPPIHDRYAYQHAKFMIIDDKWLLTGSENLQYTSMPSDDKSDGTSGNRGIWLWTDAPGPIAHLKDVFLHDLDPVHHRDLRRWSAADPQYGAPPISFTVSFTSGGHAYPIQFPQPFVLTGTFNFELVQSPENSLRDTDALLGMVAHAAGGSQVLVEQLYEYKSWGPTSSSPITDPNPRLEAYLSAARRGAVVRLLLDGAYNDPLDPRGNTATCDYVNGLAASEAINIQCLIGNPTGTGIHNTMVLVLAGGQGWVHTGSINGSENSNKQNREMAVQVQSRQAYDDLSQVFWWDWVDSGGTVVPPPTYVYLPLIMLQPTPTPTPTPTVTPTPTPTPSSAWLAYVNTYRALANLPSVTENPTWSDGDWKHARYMVKNDVISHSEDPGNPWYTPEGLAAAQNGNTFVSSSTTALDTYAIDFWMSGPFHAVAVIDPGLQQVGYGSYREVDGGWQMGATLDVRRGLGAIPPSVSFPIEYPGNGTTIGLRSHPGNEWPDPLTACPGYTAPSGLPLILQIGPGDLTPDVTAHSFMQGTTPVEHCLFDETNYTNPDSSTQNTGRSILNSRDAIVLIPRAPLTPGATYIVSITTNSQTYTWSFAVSNTAQAADQAIGLTLMR